MKEFRYEWIWKKNVPTGFFNANRAPLKTHENVLVFCDRGPPYNPQVSFSAPRKLKSCCSPTSTNYGTHHSMPTKMVNFDYPRDILEYSIDANKLHPTQKPVPLCEYLIRTYTDEGMTILDNCMGSGTTGVAAVQCNRNFIGIEKNPDYYQMAVDCIGKANYKVCTRTTLDVFA